MTAYIKKIVASWKFFKGEGGFTMIELLVATTLFVTVLSVVSGIFVSSIRSQKAVAALITANDNMFLTLEQMAREMRVGRSFTVQSQEISFTNPRGERISYRYQTELVNGLVVGRLERDVNSTGYRRLTADNVNIATDFRFLAQGHNVGGTPDGAPTRVTIILSVGALGVSTVENIFTRIQTTTTVRNLDS